MLRAEQQLDEKEKTLWYVRHSAHGQAKHLRQTIQLLRRQFCGALPLAQQERSFQTMRHLQEDRDQVRQEALRAEEQRRSLEGKAKELELKLKGLEDLTTTLKDSKGAQKVCMADACTCTYTWAQCWSKRFRLLMRCWRTCDR